MAQAAFICTEPPLVCPFQLLFPLTDTAPTAYQAPEVPSSPRRCTFAEHFGEIAVTM